jgi:anaerobic selenocysteine-containing dehydrogenase
MMLDHIAGCDHCRAIRLKQAHPENENGVCPRGERLIQAHQSAKRRAREENQ